MQPHSENNYKGLIVIFEKILKSENIIRNEPLKNHTSFKTGGNCEYFLIPENENELKETIILLKKENIPFFILGNGSNLLITDDFHKGAFISTQKLNILEEKDGFITAFCGVKLSSLCSFAASLSLRGLEELSGIPGTVGGAVYMNAGAYGGEIKDTLVKATYLTKDLEIKEILGSECNFSYRNSVFQENGGIILSATFKLEMGSKEEIKAKTLELLKKRNEKQPLEYPSAGSTFKRPEGYFAGKLIEDSGLKGYQIGGAQVSEKHCGFVINKENATSKDILELIDFIKKTVYEKQGVELQTEVKVI